MAGAKVNPGERNETARAIRTDLDEAASLINTVHAQVLSQVIKAQTWKVHRDLDGFSALRDWLVSKFDFHNRVAADLAAIARTARKYRVLTEAATAGAARVDQIAYAVRQLDKTPAMRLYARTPYREPVPSPFDPAITCPTPEHLVAEYCQHAPFGDLRRHLAEIEAACAGEDELFEGLSEQALARLEVWETETGMWAVDGLLSSDTGRLFAKLLTTAVPPPRQDDCETDPAGTDSDAATEVALPAQANRNAEALHQMLTAYGTDSRAPQRHGHTATLNLVCDIETLRGQDTGRTPTLEGDPISLAKARLLACEAGIIPSVFNYATGEAVELGRAERLPNTALRRKLELEQPEGCAWHGCGRPIQWTEAHHLVHWADGGATNAENLILLCRFHHGRIHTPGWSVTKTGPGRAVIVHHVGHEQAPADMADQAGGCGCADWRTDADLEAEFATDAANIFPTGLRPEEWALALKDDLNIVAEQTETDRAWAAAKAARAKARDRFTTEAREPASAPEHETDSEPEPAYAATDPGPTPFLGSPPREAPAAGDAHRIRAAQPELQTGGRALRRARTRHSTPLALRLSPSPPQHPGRIRPVGQPRPPTPTGSDLRQEKRAAHASRSPNPQQGPGPSPCPCPADRPDLPSASPSPPPGSAPIRPANRRRVPSTVFVAA